VSSRDSVTDQAPRLGRRERKKLETRDRIVDCAIALFAARGYDATTMDDIGECADVARATVFNYFARKDDIVSEWFARRRSELATILAEAEQHTTDTPSRIRQAFTGLAHLYVRDPDAGRAMVRAWLRAGGPLLPNAFDTSALLAHTIRSGQQRGEIPHDLDPARASQIIFDAYLGVLFRWVADDSGQFALVENLLATLDVILTGMNQSAIPQNGR
jgi:TetR/AcrR family transcriptional regulator, cholesterol catabolism regulator